MGEGSKTVEFFEDSQVGLSGKEGVEAAEVLVMLVKATDDEFGDIVGSGDSLTANGIDQFRPVELEEIKDGEGAWGDLSISILEFQDFLVAE